jgi:type II secretory pathway pseudopilin PulG
MNSRSGVSFIELLVFMVVVAAMATAIWVAVNPIRRFAQARNARRQTEVKSIADAVLDYRLDEDKYPDGIDGTWRMLGTAGSGCQMICGPGAEESTEVDLPASADSSLYENVPWLNYGWAAEIRIYPWEPSWTRRGIIRFNLSGIPAGAVVEEATLYLRESRTLGFTRTLGVHRVSQGWSEGGVTWNKRNATNNWNNPGGDFAGTATDTSTISWTGSPKWDTWDVASDVQQFVSGELDNYGWITKDVNEDSSQRFWFFYSKEGLMAPYLKVRYSVDKTASACLDLSTVLAKYLPDMPFDPKEGSSEKTYYAVKQGSQGQIQVASCAPELGEEIVVEQ